MKIGIILHADYPWNRGIERTARILSKNGHEVFILCKNTERRALKEDLGYAIVYRFEYFGKSKLNKIFSEEYFFNLLWSLWILKLAIKEKLDLLIVREIPLAIPTAIANIMLKKPMVLDMRENYPAAVEVWGKQKLIHSITRNKTLVSLLEKSSLPHFDHIIVVIEEQKLRLQRLGIPGSKITVVKNTPSRNFLKRAQKALEVFSSEKGIIKILYTGLIMDFRGLDLLVKTMPHVIKEHENVRILIAGKGDIESLRQLASHLEVEKYINFLGWVPFEEIPELIANCDIGIISNWICEHTNTTIPSKLFDYMALAKPVISSNIDPIRRIVTEENCGLIFREYNAKSLADTISTLVSNPEMREKMGENGRKAVLNKYNWEKEMKKLIKIFKKQEEELTHD